MAEHGIGDSIGAALATCLAFLAVLGAALKFWKRPEPKRPEKDEADMLWKQHVNGKLAEHDTLFKRVEVDRKEDREDFGLVFKQLDELKRSNARIEGALGIGSDGR